MNKKVIVIIGIVLFIWLFLFYFSRNKYNHNCYEVMLNNENIDYYIKETYEKTWIPYLIFAKNWKHEWGIEKNENYLNYVDIAELLKLEVFEYSCYNTSKKRIDCDKNQLNKIHVKSNITRLTIERQNQVLYDGKYITDITKYITENGRYYFKVYLTKNEEENATVDTQLIFNIKFEGENNE